MVKQNDYQKPHSTSSNLRVGLITIEDFMCKIHTYITTYMNFRYSTGGYSKGEFRAWHIKGDEVYLD